MSLETAVIILGFLSNSILLVQYTITLVHVRRGSKYTLIGVLVSL